jgi:hypothetical protein
MRRAIWSSEMEEGFLKLKATPGIGNEGTSPYGVLNESYQPSSLDISSIWIPLNER